MDSAAQNILAVDVMGSDLGPEELLEGVLLALREKTEHPFKLLLVGDEAVIGPILRQRRFQKLRESWQIIHADEVISMEEKPMQALRKKKDASMARAIELVKNGKANGALSCGNTGCLVAFSTILLRPLTQLGRPSLATIIPAIDHRFILLDVGANPEPTPLHLVHNALLGAHYCHVALQIRSPRIGLLSIGTEEGKGNEIIQRTHEVLKKLSSIVNYVGLIEGFQLFENQVDVVVCDGFVGNILLKSMESMARTVKSFLRKELFKNPLRALGSLLAFGAMRTIRKKLSTEKYGGAPLLGLNGSIFKAHGSSSRGAIKHAILIANRFCRGNSPVDLLKQMDFANEVINEEKKPLGDDVDVTQQDEDELGN